jgi:hypothetical protein
MPFTLVPIMIKNFIFGPFMCITIRYAQGKSTFLFIVDLQICMCVSLITER